MATVAVPPVRVIRAKESLGRCRGLRVMRRYLEEENASRQPEDIPRPEAHKKTVRRYSPLGIAFRPCAPPNRAETSTLQRTKRRHDCPAPRLLCGQTTRRTIEPISQFAIRDRRTRGSFRLSVALSLPRPRLVTRDC